MRERVRYVHYRLRPEEAYVHWVRDYVRFHGRRHPHDLGGPEVEAFLSWLSNERGVSVSTHRQALSAVLFLYQQVLGQQLPWMAAIGRPQRKPRLPVVLSVTEVAAVLGRLDGVHGVLARLLYGTGMRIAEALQLRVKDVDFERRAIIVRAGKGGKDRVVMLPASLGAKGGGASAPAQHAGAAQVQVLQAVATGILPMRPCHSRGPVWCTLVPLESTATVTGMSRTSNS